MTELKEQLSVFDEDWTQLYADLFEELEREPSPSVPQRVARREPIQHRSR